MTETLEYLHGYSNEEAWKELMIPRHEQFGICFSENEGLGLVMRRVLKAMLPIDKLLDATCVEEAYDREQAN